MKKINYNGHDWVAGEIISENLLDNIEYGLETVVDAFNSQESYFTLKEFKSNGQTTGASLQNCINYVCSNRVVSTAIEYDGISVGGTVIDLCGEEITVDSVIYIAHDTKRYSHLTIQNGTLKAGSSFSSKHMLMIGNLAHNRCLRFMNVVFDCNLKCSPFYMNRTLNTIFYGCTFTNLKYPAELCYEQTHETVFDSCYFTNAKVFEQGHKTEFALIMGVDGHVTNCNFIGFVNGIECVGGCNMINNNHFYYLDNYGVVTRESTILNNIYGNYFDGCSLYIENEYADMNVVSNVFLEPQYASGIHTLHKIHRCNISNNTYDFTSEKREKLFNINCTISGNTMTSSSSIFDKYDVGATTEDGSLCITGYVNSKTVKVAYDSRVIKTGKSLNLWLFPTNVSTLEATNNLSYTSVGYSDENIVNGTIPNASETFWGDVNTSIMAGEIMVNVHRDNKVYVNTSCYTTANQGSATNFLLGSLPEWDVNHPSQCVSVPVLVVNPNNEADVLGYCMGCIYPDGSIYVYKKAGEFSSNSVEYRINAVY